MWTRVGLALAGLAGLWLFNHDRDDSDCLHTSCLGEQEFRDLNCGSYHDPAHTLEVAALVVRMARAWGYPLERVRFLKNAALLHDADERVDKESGQVCPGTPARVPVTLEWMEDHQSRLCRDLGWSDDQFLGALALIARTEFPFDHTPRFHGTRRDGQSAIEVHTNLIQRLPRSVQLQTLKDGLLLRFADQAAPYVDCFEIASRRVKELSEELECDPVKLWEGTPHFIDAMGTDLAADRKLAQELGFDPEDLPGRECFLDLLSPKSRRNMSRNRSRFEQRRIVS